MKTERLDYDLPAELIAQQPAKLRSGSRLLVMQRTERGLCDRRFTDIVEYVRAGDCLVFNDTKVLAARFFARRPTGAKLEGLMLSDNGSGRWEVMLKNSRKVRPGRTIILCDRAGAEWGRATAVERLGGGRWMLELKTDKSAEDVLAQIGFAPLPPYIKRSRDSDLAELDLKRYQTIYAQKTGAVAAPTAGLHFTPEVLDGLKDKGAVPAYVTLHVGAGTFKPIVAENLQAHQMHTERFSLCDNNAKIINDCIARGGRIIAVGTTSVRTLETICQAGKVKAAQGSTRLFIQPGYKFRIVDAMLTNFHLPRSTLLALVGAFAGLENVLAAYHHAIQQRYRFYSYGDAMLII